MIDDIEWIFFDVGSTLVDESAAFRHRINDAIEDSNVTYSQFYEAMMGFYKENKKGDLEAIELFGLKKTPWHSEDETLYPEASGCLRTLKKRYNIGIIANQPAGTEERLRGMGIMDYIDLVVSSAEEGVSKPDPRIFRIALERVGCPAARAAMVGDRLDNDIGPAKRLGMKTVWVRQGFGGMMTPANGDEEPDYAADNLDGVCNLFVGNAVF